jgi:cathepsin L
MEIKYDREWDWRKKGVVNPAKNQKKCGSCWAFGTIQGGESAYAICSGKLLRFSEQCVMDCTHNHCHACGGGNAPGAYDWILKWQAGKYMLESDYPYHAARGYCLFNASKAVGMLKAVHHPHSGNEDDLATRIQAIGPATVSIEANHHSFMHYHGGIFDEPSCGGNLDHSVGCVGWGVEGDKTY